MASFMIEAYFNLGEGMMKNLFHTWFCMHHCKWEIRMMETQYLICGKQHQKEVLFMNFEFYLNFCYSKYIYQGSIWCPYRFRGVIPLYQKTKGFLQTSHHMMPQSFSIWLVYERVQEENLKTTFQNRNQRKCNFCAWTDLSPLPIPTT